MKKLIFKQFLRIKEGNSQGSRWILAEEHPLNFPKMIRNSRIDLREPSYGAHKIANFQIFLLKTVSRTVN